jgi:hypothetical protein
MKQD